MGKIQIGFAGTSGFYNRLKHEIDQQMSNMEIVMLMEGVETVNPSSSLKQIFSLLGVLSPFNGGTDSSFSDGWMGDSNHSLKSGKPVFVFTSHTGSKIFLEALHFHYSHRIRSYLDHQNTGKNEKAGTGPGNLDNMAKMDLQADNNTSSKGKSSWNEDDIPDRIRHLIRDRLSWVQIACVGPATAEPFTDAGISSIWIPVRHTTHDLARLVKMRTKTDTPVYLFRSALADHRMEEILGDKQLKRIDLYTVTYSPVSILPSCLVEPACMGGEKPAVENAEEGRKEERREGKTSVRIQQSHSRNDDDDQDVSRESCVDDQYAGDQQDQREWADIARVCRAIVLGSQNGAKSWLEQCCRVNQDPLLWQYFILSDVTETALKGLPENQIWKADEISAHGLAAQISKWICSV